MTALENTLWSDSFILGIPDVDDEHRGLFAALSDLSAAVSTQDRARAHRNLRSIAEHVGDHFTHEERLMRRAGYSGYLWHKRQHETARKRAGALLQAACCGGWPECERLMEFLASWLPDHIGLHDRMMSASLRNHSRLDRKTASLRSRLRSAPRA